MCPYIPSYTTAYPVYQPAMRVITHITNAFPALVTTSINHQYNDGIIVRLIIPQGFGMLQANGLIGTITVVGDTSFLVSIDTTFFDVFTLPSTFPLMYNDAQVVPIGEENELLKNATRNVLPYT